MSEHRLQQIHEFTTRISGWRPTEGGGQRPVWGPLPRAYWRWYCACGAVGGRADSPDDAAAAYARHAQVFAANP